MSSFNSNGGGGLSTGFKTIIENNLQLSTVSSPPMMDKIQSNIEGNQSILLLCLK